MKRRFRLLEEGGAWWLFSQETGERVYVSLVRPSVSRVQKAIKEMSTRQQAERLQETQQCTS